MNNLDRLAGERKHTSRINNLDIFENHSTRLLASAQISYFRIFFLSAKCFLHYQFSQNVSVLNKKTNFHTAPVKFDITGRCQ